jgi:hypothetical protein
MKCWGHRGTIAASGDYEVREVAAQAAGRVRGGVMRKFGLVLVLATLVVGCTKDEITAVYYPDRANLSHRMMDVVGSAEECRAWVSQ